MAVPPPHDRDPTYFELIAESFTTGDNLNHNAGIASQTTLIRTMFILSNLGYLYAAIGFYSHSNSSNSLQASLAELIPKANPVLSLLASVLLKALAAVDAFFPLESYPVVPDPLLPSAMSSVCANRTVNAVGAALIFLASTTFHTKQCFRCRTRGEMSSCVWWNEVDLACAGSYGAFLFLCFFKRNLLHFVPCLLLLVGGGVMKLQGYYKVYFALHGLWHVLGACWFLEVVCEEGKRMF